MQQILTYLDQMLNIFSYRGKNKKYGQIQEEGWNFLLAGWQLEIDGH